MKIHLPWIRVTAAAVLVAGVGVHEAAAQYAPYRPIAPQLTAPAAAVPVVASPQQTAYPTTQAPNNTLYTAYRTTAAPAAPAASPTGSQYTQPTAAYSQYPQTPAQQYPTSYGAYPYVAQQPTTPELPAPANTSAAQPSGTVMPTPANGMPRSTMNAPGACGCNAANYGAGDYYTAPGCGSCASGGYPNCGATNYCDTGCNDNQWFGGIYFLGMTRTSSTPIKLTSEIPGGSSYPYYPTAVDTVLTTRDADYDWTPGVEVRFGSTFTIGESCNTCQSTCGYNTGCGCNSCTPQTVYAWEFAWWGLDDSESSQRVDYTPGNPMVGMKNFYGLSYGGNPVNNYYGYPITANGQAGYPTVEWQRVRTNWSAQNLELNIIRFPMCNTGCSTSSCGCNSGCGGCDSCGCDSCGLGFSMYGSCGVRYFRVDDDFLYGTYANATELNTNINVDNNLIGPQVGWTTDYCWGKWNLFCNSTFGIFDNHMNVQNRQYGPGGYSTFGNSGDEYNLKSSKDAVAFLGELRVGTAYDISCHWRAVVAYRAIAITGLATSADQLTNDYSDSSYVAIINSDNSVIIHGVQVGAECRY